MSGFSLPVTRPAGRAIVVGSATCRAATVALLGQLGYQCTEMDEPYAAMAEVCRRPAGVDAMILNLQNLYREELTIIGVLKRRFPDIEIWLAQTDGRPAALAEASQLGADGLVSEEGLHRFTIAGAGGGSAAGQSAEAVAGPAAGSLHAATPAGAREDDSPGQRAAGEPGVSEPVLTADELRALLQEQPGGPKPEES